MMNEELNRSLAALSISLPDEVMSYKALGDFEKEKEAVLRWLEKPGSDELKERLLIELEYIRRYEKQFPYTEEEAVEFARKDCKDFTAEDLQKLSEEGLAEWIPVNGEKHYIHSFWENILHMSPETRMRALGKPENNEAFLKPILEAMDVMREKGGIDVKITLETSIAAKDEFFTPGMKLMARLPYPSEAFQHQHVTLLSSSDENPVIAPSGAPARTVYMERTENENRPFSIRYSYVTSMKYQDPLSRASEAIAADPVEFKEDLKEELPHIVFSPELRALSKSIVGDEKNPLLIAKKIYDYITLNVRYSYVRSYFMLENIPEYCLKNLRGDCGLQGLSFVTLCRLNGIPAKWQSGNFVDPSMPSSHDWAMFYVAPFGWMFADPSFGGAGHRFGIEAMREFYFCNLDPYRMAANHMVCAPFTPDVTFRRMDPTDNQTGELETEDFGFEASEVKKTAKTISIERLE